MSGFKEIWERLNKIDVSKYVEKKNQCNYLSWSNAWALMMQNYPEITYKFGDLVTFPDGTAEVNCTVQIGAFSRSVWLPVMRGYSGKAVENPNARDISDAKMRCLVKCFALFGLGMYLYQGEDLPKDDAPASDEMAESTFIELINEAVQFDVFRHESEFKNWVKIVTGSKLYALSEIRGQNLLNFLRGNRDVGQWSKTMQDAVKEVQLTP
jgi:hypothetical protein